MYVFKSKADAKAWIKKHCNAGYCTVLVRITPYRVDSMFLSDHTQEMHWEGLSRWIQD
jgi:hypothetical protein